MNKNELTAELSTIISSLIGHHVGIDHIHTDNSGWDYYIPAKSLKENHPLILNHYRGPLFMVVPVNDWKRLEDNEITVKEYIDNSVWSFGYFWGGGSMLSGVYWKPFEEKGIHEKEKIDRYLTILSCRTYHHSSGYMPDEKNCMSCHISKCPFSNYKESCEGASWDNEVKEVDDRITLYKAVKHRIYQQFGLEAVFCLNNAANTIRIYPNFEKNTIAVYLPEKILIDMLYHPGKHDIEKVANSLQMEIGIPWSSEGKNEAYPVTSGTTVETFYEVWKSECPRRISNWFETKDKAKYFGKRIISIFKKRT